MFVCQYIWVLGIIYKVAPAEVFQTPESTSVISGADVTFKCLTSSVHDNSDVNVYWWRLGDKHLLKPSSDGSKRFFPLENGEASFQIVNVRVPDSGFYYCGVRYTGNRIVNGTGSKLVVHASPEPVSLSPKVSGTNSSALTLVCATAVFYPEPLTFTWYKNDTNIVTGITTIKKLNSEGIYEASSSLNATQLAESGVIYTCVVSHLTLQSPAVAVYFDSTSNPGNEHIPHYLLISGCTGGALILLALVAVIGKSCQLSNCKGARRKEEESQHFEERTMKETVENRLL
ncbi:natural cytotoxicity triggering receptor 3 ligand 1-like [Heptranchias perlo]|uniref:natural cytotoxicity triggering receptor 3 ligand 1-like n=1 Tax=Heptranchias perlo TaxID=212740 RepID=UPI0035594AD0